MPAHCRGVSGHTERPPSLIGAQDLEELLSSLQVDMGQGWPRSHAAQTRLADRAVGRSFPSGYQIDLSIRTPICQCTDRVQQSSNAAIAPGQRLLLTGMQEGAEIIHDLNVPLLLNIAARSDLSCLRFHHGDGGCAI